MDYLTAVKYTLGNRSGESLDKSVVQCILDGMLGGDGALVLIDMIGLDDSKLSRKFGKFTQNQYIGEVYKLMSSLSGLKPGVANCYISSVKGSRFTEYNTRKFSRSGSGSVLADGGTLEGELKNANKIIVAGWDANMCVANSVFGIPCQNQDQTTVTQPQNLLSKGKTVITSRVLLVSEPKDKALEHCWGVLSGM